MANKRPHSRTSTNRAGPGSIEPEISALAELSLSDLRKAWTGHLANNAPAARSRSILCRLLVWQLQSDAMGDLDSATKHTLIKIGEALRRGGSYEPKSRSGFSPGVVLSREWKGVIHRVTAAEVGFDYLGKRYRSLSDIARTITGTRWSGPRFFGLEQKTASTSRAAAR